MKDVTPSPSDALIVVIGAGIGGLAAGMRLAAAGRRVMVLDRHAAPGGKMRQLPSVAGGVDAGPTVLTMRHVFDELFAAAGTALDTHVTLYKQDLLARHWWPGSGPLDLFADPQRSAESVEAFAGESARREYERFYNSTRTLFDAFRDPFIDAAEPSIATLTRTVMSNPRIVPAMAPGQTLAAKLRGAFTDPRLRQLFGRYATYVGGSPYQSPALLSLIWQAEAAGVWVVDGGMHALARAITQQIESMGGTVRCNAHVARIETDAHGVTGVTLENGETISASSIVFNGDPRALATGALGPALAKVAPQTVRAKRSLSAQVWAFAAEPRGIDLAHHNVFFCQDPRADFDALRRGRLAEDTTLYVCAMDRGLPDTPPRIERFEIILNAPPLLQRAETDKEFQSCHRRTFPVLKRFGLSFLDEPKQPALTVPSGFDALFPATDGSLYGQTPHGMTASLNRPRARTTIPGLFLCGGGCHPGAGVPMSALSGRHAAEAILKGQTSTSKFRQTGTRGGTLTPSPIVEPARSR